MVAGNGLWAAMTPWASQHEYPSFVSVSSRMRIGARRHGHVPPISSTQPPRAWRLLGLVALPNACAPLPSERHRDLLDAAATSAAARLLLSQSSFRLDVSLCLYRQ